MMGRFFGDGESGGVEECEMYCSGGRMRSVEESVMGSGMVWDGEGSVLLTWEKRKVNKR